MRENVTKEGRGKGIERARVVRAILVWIIGIIIVLSNVSCGKGGEGKEEDKTDEIKEITTVSVIDEEIEYDGEKHGIRIKGIEAWDAVSYRIEGGEWQSEEIRESEPGEYRIAVRIEREGYETYEGEGVLRITRTELKGIELKNVRIMYDGEEHGPEITGIEDGDEIEYYVDGERRDEIRLREVGRYGIRIRVERKGEGYYEGESEYEIVPDVRGIYVGEKEVEEIRGIEDLERYEEIKDEYRKLEAREKVYVIKINGETEKCYVTEKGIRIETEYKDGRTAIEINGETVKETDEYNYCGSVTQGNIEREIAENRTTTEIESEEKITEVEITLQRLKEQEIEGKSERVEYDGEEHGPGISYDGEILYKQDDGSYGEAAPVFKEVGRYEYEIVVIRAGYLPKALVCVMEIVKEESGRYYGKKGIIEIDKGEATLNGKEIEGYVSTENGVRYEGEEYKRHNGESVIGIGINGEYRYTESGASAYKIKTDGTEIVVYDYETDEAIMRIDMKGKSIKLAESDTDIRYDEEEQGYLIFREEQQTLLLVNLITE